MALAGCGGGGGGGPKYSVSVTVSGLQQHTSVTLSDNGSDDLTVSENETVAFAKSITSGGAYSVAVVTQPNGETCVVNNGIGTMPGHDIIIGVSCIANNAVSVVVTGITNVSGLALQDNGGDNLAVSTSGTYQFATSLAQGQSYDVTVLTQPTGHVCSVLNGSGTVGTENVSVTVACPWHVGYLGYKGLGGGNWIAAYYIDQSTGATTENDLFPAGNGPWAISVSPAGGFLYADNETDNTVSAYSIDPTNGDLNPVPGSPFSVGAARTSGGAAFPHSIAIDSQGHFVYVLDWQGDVVAFGIDTSTGALTHLSTTALGISNAFGLTVSSRNVLYVIGSPSANPGEADIAAYTVSTGTGALTPVTGPFTFLSSSGSMDVVTGYGWAIDPAARFFYVTFTQEGAVPRPTGAYTVASIDATTGGLSAVSGSPFALTHTVDSIAIDNTGKFFYGGNSYENYIQEFDIDQSTGELTGFATEYLPGPLDVSAPYLSGIDPSNTYLFCSQTPYSPYSINSGSSLPPGTPGILDDFLNGTTTAITNAVPVAFSNIP